MSDQFTDREIEILDIFIESVDELLGSQFLKQSQSNGISTNISWLHDGLSSQQIGPQREAVKAFLLTLRFFRQNNEPTSLCNMEDLISGLAIDKQLKDRFRQSRANFNDYLDEPPSTPFPGGCGAETRRNILDGFLYGVFAHANPKHRRRVKTWDNAPYSSDVRAQFDLILLQFLIALAALANICRDARGSLAH